MKSNQILALLLLPTTRKGRHGFTLIELLVVFNRLFLLPALIAGLGFILADRVTAQTLTTLHSFAGNGDRRGPYYAGLIVSGNTLYGTTHYGGSSDNGGVFAVHTDGTGFTILYSFSALSAPYSGTNRDGAYPNADLIVSGNILYGTARNGGCSGHGTVFRVNTDGTGFTNLHSFTNSSDGAYPQAGLILSGNTLYGTAAGDRISGSGTVFAVNTDGTGFTNLHGFTNGSDGAMPFAGLVLAGNTLYGTAAYGGTKGNGTVFAVNTDGIGFTNLHSFDYVSDGDFSQAGLILAGNTLYGTASAGGNWGRGTVFKVNTDGTGFTNLHIFTGGSDGATPLAKLVLLGNTLYGTAYSGGSWGRGTVFAVNTDGTGFTNLHDFTVTTGGLNSDGANPAAGLVLSGVTLYGTAERGGGLGAGTVFKVNTDGAGFTNPHSFDYDASDGAGPKAGLILSGNTLYGTATFGGGGNAGTVFSVNTDGTGFMTLHRFTATSWPYPSTNSDGANPSAGLVLSSNTLYGTANQGGSSGLGTVFKVNTDGAGFAILHTFTGGSDGGIPYAELLLSGNTLYGTACDAVSGWDGWWSTGPGTVFAVNTDGTGFTNLYRFTGGFINSDGANPYAGLFLSGNTFYGTTLFGGGSGRGTVFSLSFAPQLTIIPSGANVILTWPTNVAGFSYAGYTLQSTTSLVSPFWATVSPGPVVINGQNTVTNPVSGTQNFYRLSQ